MTKTSTIWADFHNADEQGRVRLNTAGTLESLAASGLWLKDGLHVVVHDDELETDGTVAYSTEEQLWVATIDWNAFRQAHPAGQLQQVL
jgi:hypothetical protein